MRKPPFVILLVMCLVGMQITSCVPAVASPASPVPLTPRGLAFGSTTHDVQAIYYADVGLSSITPISGSLEDARCPAWSPDGSRVTFCAVSDDASRLFVMGANGSGARVLAPEPAGCFCNPEVPVAWSPDGQWIALPVKTRSDSGAAWDVYLVAADGASPRNLTNAPARYYSLLWAPDSRSILFSGPLNGVQDIYRMDIRSGKAQPLLLSPVAGAPSGWSPDGKTLLYYADSGGGNFDIFTLAEGSQPVRLTDAPGFDQYPHWFDGSKSILFVSRRDGDDELYVMNADGSQQRNLTQNPGIADVWPSIPADGRQVIYMTYVGNQWDSWMMDTDGANRRKLTDLIGITSDFAWQP